MPFTLTRSVRPHYIQDFNPALHAYPEALLPLVAAFKQSIELAVLKATAQLEDPVRYPMPTDGDSSLETILWQRLQSLSPVQQQLASINFQPRMERLAILNASDENSLTGQGGIDLESLHTSIPIFETTARTLARSAVRLRTQLQETVSPVPVMQVHSGTAYPPLQALLKFHRVKCVDETDPEGGDDEIQLGATIVNVDGRTTKLGPFPIRDDFDDNEEQRFNPAWHFHTFQVVGGNDSGPFPRYCACVITLAEVDNGEFPEFLQKIYDFIRGKVSEAIQAAGGAIGGPVGAGLGAVVSKAVDYLLGELLELIKAIWEDDLFPPQTIELYFPHRYTSFNGARHSPLYTAWLSGHGGTYAVDYSWELIGVMEPIVDPVGEEPPRVGPEGAIIYMGTYFQGNNKFLKPGEHRFAAGPHPDGRRWQLPSPFNDEVNSIKVGEGYVARCYKTHDLTGESIEVYHDTPLPYMNPQWRDQISSIFVQKIAF